MNYEPMTLYECQKRSDLTFIGQKAGSKYDLYVKIGYNRKIERAYAVYNNMNEEC